MPENSSGQRDDPSTIIAISALGYIVADLLHEVVGHAVTAWLSGAQKITISTVALQSDIGSKWISANGTFSNLFFALLFWVLLVRFRNWRPATRYFLVVALASNLFTGTGYFFFSGVANIGDWAAVIRGLQPAWAWRVGLIMLGCATYYAAVLVVGEQLKPFHANRNIPSRIPRLCWTAYLTQAALAGVSGLLNPAGLIYVITSALSSSLGANAGWLALLGIKNGWKDAAAEPVNAIGKSLPWIFLGGIASLLFIFVLGRGITFNR